MMRHDRCQVDARKAVAAYLRRAGVDDTLAYGPIQVDPEPGNTDTERFIDVEIGLNGVVRDQHNGDFIFWGSKMLAHFINHVDEVINRTEKVRFQARCEEEAVMRLSRTIDRKVPPIGVLQVSVE